MENIDKFQNQRQQNDNNKTTTYGILQGPQGLSGHFEMALTGRKKVAKSKLMVASNSQQRHIFRHMVSFYVPIKPWPQQLHKVTSHWYTMSYIYPFAQRFL